VNHTLISGGSNTLSVAVDSGHTYWTNSAIRTIGRANLDGTEAKQSFISGASNVFGVAVDVG
jgi:hypothetical protein